MRWKGKPGRSVCWRTRFKRKEAVAWRIRVLDQTGQQMDVF
jgi:hypothetical protein